MNAYLELQHRRCVGCKVYFEYFAASTEALVKRYTGQILNEKSDASVPDEVVYACQIVIRELCKSRARKWMRSWKMSRELRPLPMCASNIRMTHI